MRLLIDCAYYAAAPFIVPVYLWKRYRHNKYTKSLPGMFGKFWRHENTAMWANGCVWVHAVSVGEVLSLDALLKPLQLEFPALPILLTVTTETGHAAAQKFVEGGEVAAVHFFPFDFSWNLTRFLNHFKPKLYIGLETELWPNLFRTLQAFGCPIFIFNGRISPKSFRKYERFPRIFQSLLKPVTAFGVQTQRDADFLTKLTATPERLLITGNIKLDKPPRVYDEQTLQDMREQCACVCDDSIVVFGSTHRGEEELAIELAGTSQLSNIKVLCVPRHPERFASVWNLIQSSSIPSVRLSTGELSNCATPTAAKLVLVDKMGILDHLYAIASVAVVCGTFIPGIGGHNLLEPAFHGVPVFYGPHHWGQQEMHEIICNNGGFVSDASSLTNEIIQLLTKEPLRADVAQQAKSTAESSRGAVSRNMELLRKYLNLDETNRRA